MKGAARFVASVVVGVVTGLLIAVAFPPLGDSGVAMLLGGGAALSTYVHADAIWQTITQRPGRDT